MSEIQLNDHHIHYVRGLYSESSKLLKDKFADADTIGNDTYSELRLELQKLGFASIYNLKKCTLEGREVDLPVIQYMEKRFTNLNNIICTVTEAPKSK